VVVFRVKVEIGHGARGEHGKRKEQERKKKESEEKPEEENKNSLADHIWRFASRPPHNSCPRLMDLF
jgi:hypothetical protein